QAELQPMPAPVDQRGDRTTSSCPGFPRPRHRRGAAHNRKRHLAGTATVLIAPDPHGRGGHIPLASWRRWCRGRCLSLGYLSPCLQVDGVETGSGQRTAPSSERENRDNAEACPV